MLTSIVWSEGFVWWCGPILEAKNARLGSRSRMRAIFPAITAMVRQPISSFQQQTILGEPTIMDPEFRFPILVAQPSPLGISIFTMKYLSITLATCLLASNCRAFVVPTARRMNTQLKMVTASASSQLAQLAGMTTLSIDSGDLKVIEEYAKTGFITDATTNPLFVSQAGLSGDPMYAEVCGLWNTTRRFHYSTLLN